MDNRVEATKVLSEVVDKLSELIEEATNGEQKKKLITIRSEIVYAMIRLELL